MVFSKYIYFVINYRERAEENFLMFDKFRETLLQKIQSVLIHMDSFVYFSVTVYSIMHFTNSTWLN